MNTQTPKRLGIFLMLFALQLLYFPINRIVYGGISTLSPIDDYIKLTPIWAVPYLLSIYWWLGSIMWAMYKIEFPQLVNFSLCLSLTIMLSYIAYLFFPTYVIRPVVNGEDFFTKLIMYIYSNDRPYNVLPSNHTYTALILSIFWSRWYPRQRTLWVLIAFIVILSTLFTKQHAVLDVLASIILGGICYKVSEYIMRRNKFDLEISQL